MAAGGEKQAIGKRQRAGQPRRQRVGLEMIDRDQRRVVHHRDRLGCGEAHDDAADQAGAGGGGDRGKLRKADACFLHRAATMPSSTSTWARAAISGTTPPNGMCSSICERTMLDRIRPDAVGAALDHGGGGLVAGGLDAEHQHPRVVTQFEPLRYRRTGVFVLGPKRFQRSGHRFTCRNASKSSD